MDKYFMVIPMDQKNNEFRQLVWKLTTHVFMKIYADPFAITKYDYVSL